MKPKCHLAMKRQEAVVQCGKDVIDMYAPVIDHWADC